MAKSKKSLKRRKKKTPKAIQPVKKTPKNLSQNKKLTKQMKENGFVEMKKYPEGIIYKRDSKYSDIVEVIVTGAVHPIDLNTYCHNIVTSKPIKTTTLKGAGFTDTKTGFNREKETLKLLHLANISLSFNNGLKELGVKQANKGCVDHLEGRYLKIVDGVYEIDYELIDNIVYQLETRAASKDLTLHKALCEELDLKFTGVGEV